MIQAGRVHELNGLAARAGKYVLYWMQASVREGCNYALEYAIERANGLGVGVVVCFGVIDGYPEANERHYAVMLQGLAEAKGALAKRGIKLVVRHGEMVKVVVGFAKEACLVVTDMGYTAFQRGWRDGVADGAGCEVVRVESDVVVPVEVVSQKHEYAARTIRPRIQREVEGYLKPLRPGKVGKSSMGMRFEGLFDVADPAAALQMLKLDRSVGESRYFKGGQGAARRMLSQFLSERLRGYGQGRNEPADGWVSHMSIYLHFGHISPVEIALAVKGADAPEEDKEKYLEELIVRRELSMNFCHFEPRYSEYAAIPQWARKSLEKHVKDERPYLYSRRELEAGETHDPYWNAAQREMVKTGFMHNYMRMYWGKKFIEWTRSPQEAFEWLLGINNKYMLDGRDPNSFANVGWIFGLHDRPWGPERKIFGLVRYMNAAGLERKFDMARYVGWVEGL